jgi:hypothetical protein
MLQTNKILKATALQTQILCYNTLYEHSKQIIAKEVSFLSDFLGKGILKSDGSFKAKYIHDLLRFKEKVNKFGFDFWVDTHYYFICKYGKLSIEVTTTVSGGGYDRSGVNANHSQNRRGFDLFVVDNGILLSLFEDNRDFLNVVYDEAEILNAADNVKEAAKEYEKTLKTVPHIFRQSLYLQRLCN